MDWGHWPPRRQFLCRKASRGLPQMRESDDAGVDAPATTSGSQPSTESWGGWSRSRLQHQKRTEGIGKCRIGANHA